MSSDLEKARNDRMSRAEDEANWADTVTDAAAPLEPAWPRTWRAYTSLLGCFFLMFNSWGLVNAYGTFLSYYSDSLLERYGILETNLIGATQCFVVLFLSFAVGRLLDANHSRLLMIIGTCFVAVGMFLLSVVNGNGGYNQGNLPLIWLFQGLITGIGMACFFVTSSQVAATWFIQRKGFAVGIVASGASISGLVYPIMLRFLIQSHGFNFAVRMVATLSVVTCIGSILLARPNPEHMHNHPEKWLSRATWVDYDAWRSATFLWFTAAICFLFFGFYAIFFNLEEWAAKNNVGIHEHSPPAQKGLRTYYLLAIMNASSTIGRIGSAFLLTRYNALNVHFVVTFASSMLCFFMWTFTKTPNTAIAFVIIFGAFSGSVIGLPPASMAAILNSRGEKLGQWTGMMYTTSAPFALAGPVIAGYLIGKYNTHITVQMWSGACLLVSAFCMFMSIVYHKRDLARWNNAGRQESDENDGGDTPRSRFSPLGSSLGSTMTFWSKKGDA